MGVVLILNYLDLISQRNLLSAAGMVRSKLAGRAEVEVTAVVRVPQVLQGKETMVVLEFIVVLVTHQVEEVAQVE